MLATKIKLYVNNSTVYGWVMAQNESDRNKVEGDHLCLYKNNNVKIWSGDIPDLEVSNGTIHLSLRGSEREYDNKVFSYDAKTYQDAMDMANDIKRAIEEYNNYIMTNVVDSDWVTQGRLPKLDGLYLVTLQDLTVTVAEYDDRDSSWMYYDTNEDEWFLDKECLVVAWKELPKPPLEREVTNLVLDTVEIC